VPTTNPPASATHLEVLRRAWSGSVTTGSTLNTERIALGPSCETGTASARTAVAEEITAVPPVRGADAPYPARVPRTRRFEYGDPRVPPRPHRGHPACRVRVPSRAWCVPRRPTTSVATTRTCRCCPPGVTNPSRAAAATRLRTSAFHRRTPSPRPTPPVRRCRRRRARRHRRHQCRPRRPLRRRPRRRSLRRSPPIPTAACASCKRRTASA
jgi:hypothetical protein